MFLPLLGFAVRRSLNSRACTERYSLRLLASWPEPCASAGRGSNTRRPASSSDSFDLSPARADAGDRPATRRLRRGVLAALIGLPLFLGLAAGAQAQNVRVAFSSSNPTMAENGSTGDYVAFAAVINSATTSMLTVNYTMTGTATPGTDYTISGGTFNYSSGTGTFTIPAGTDTYPHTFSVFTVMPTPDNIQDSGETIILTLVDGTGYVLGGGTERTITLLDNSGESTFKVSGNPWVGETLTINRTADDPDGNGTVHSRFWQKRSPGGEWSTIKQVGTRSNVNSETYVVRAEDLGMELRGWVSYTDGVGLTAAVYTSPVGPVEPAGGSAVEWNACVPQALQDHVDARIVNNDATRWKRVKNALTDRSNAITLAEVKEIRDRRAWYGWSTDQWDPVIAALECIARGLPSNAPVISISAGDNITEGGTARFTLMANPVPASDLTVAVQMKNININVRDDDGDIRTRELAIGTSGTATLDIVTENDSNEWPAGTVYVAVQPGTTYRVAREPNDAAWVSVANNDFPSGYPRLSVADATVSEGARNCVRNYFTCMKFRVTLSRALEEGERVDFIYETQESSSGSPATAREDFFPVEGLATFKPGDPLTQTIEVHIYDDNIDDQRETFDLVITYAWGAEIADDVGVGTIR